MTLNSGGVERARPNTRVIDGKRRCSRCGEYKAESEFSGAKAYYCKPCVKSYRQPVLEAAKERRAAERRNRPKLPPEAKRYGENVLGLYGPSLKTVERAHKIFELKNAGLTYAEIGKILGVKRQYVQHMVGPSEFEKQFIMTLDGKHCRMCGASKEEARLDIHHIRYSRSIDDTITVCQTCHRRLKGLCREFGAELSPDADKEAVA